MNFKKFISGVSAFAIAASAFAGMAVTANAATKTTVVYSNNGGSKGNGTASIDISGALNDIGTATDVQVTYTVSTTVDFSNTGGNRPGTATLTAKDSNDGDLNLVSIYTNTKKNLLCRRYAVGEVATETSTTFDSSDDNSTSHDYYVTLNLDLANDTLSGTIVKGENETSVTIPSTSFDIASLKSIELYSATTANNMSVSSFKVSVVEELNYFLTTAPYAKVTVDGVVYYSDANGDVNVSNVENGDAIKVEKDGYVTATDTVDLTNGNEIPLTPATGIAYKESFDYVTDNFGFASGVTVANGVLAISETAAADNSSTSVPETNVKGKTIHFVTASNCASANHYGYLAFSGTSLKLYYYGNQIRLHGASNSKTGFATISGDATVDIVISSANTAATLYVNGREVSYANYSGDKLTGLATEWGKGTFKATLSELSVIDSVGTASVKIGDADAVTYLKGTKITIPAAEEGFEWKDANSDVVNAGEITVTEDLVLTAVAKSAPADQTYDKGYTFTTSNDVASKKYTTLTINVKDTDNNDAEGHATIDIKDQIATISGPAALTIFIMNIPAAYEVTSVELN